MFSFALIAAWLCVAAWLYLVAGHGRFWSVRAAQAGHGPQRSQPVAAPGPSVAVVIPARNEAEVIGRAIQSLLQQGVPSSRRRSEQALSHALDEEMGARQVNIFVVDDSSSDGTADAARVAGAASLSPSVGDRMGAADSVTVISGRPLPPGWTGKLWAMQQGIEQALQLNPDFLLLTDADIEHAPGSLAALVAIAEAGGYDLVSFMVKLHSEGVAEKLLIPAFVFFFFMLYPPEWLRDSRHRTAGAAGGCMLIRPSALERIGGIAAIRHEIIDDCALARAVKRSGGRIWLGLERSLSGHDFSRAGRAANTKSSGFPPAAYETRSLRAYRSFAEIERMIARTAFNQLHHSVWLLLGTLLGMLLLYLLPLALIVSGEPRLAFAGAFGYGLMTFAYMPMVRFYRLNRLWALTLPAAALFYTAATIHSAVKYWTGRGGEWKGRAQDVV